MNNNNNQYTDFIENESILERLENRKKTEVDSVKVEKTIKYVIFDIDASSFAILGDLVQEIVIDYEIYYLPFMPPYIRGLINRQGEPYTVVDLKVLFDKEKLDGKKFIIMRDKIDKLSFLITDISKIINVEKKNINEITSEDMNRDYFKEAISIENIKIPVLDINTVVKKIEEDINE